LEFSFTFILGFSAFTESLYQLIAKATFITAKRKIKFTFLVFIYFLLFV